jgi:hypothetical protein
MSQTLLLLIVMPGSKVTVCLFVCLFCYNVIILNTEIDAEVNLPKVYR